LVITIGDGATLQEALGGEEPLCRLILTQLVSALNKVKKNDRLYLRLQRPAPGVVIGTSEMPKPSSVGSGHS
jgi:hypothetical protein